MRKFLTAILITVMILISTTSPVVSAGDTSGEKVERGELKEAVYAVEGDYEVIRVSVPGYADYSCFELTAPLRVVVDMQNVSAPGKQEIVEAGGRFVRRIRFAQFEPGIARIVLDVNEGYDYTIEGNDAGLIIYISEKKAPEKPAAANTLKFAGNLSIRHITNETNESIFLTLPNYEGYRVSRLTDPERLVITIPDAGFISTGRQAVINGKQIRAVSYQNSGKRGAVITLSLNGQYQYGFTEYGDRLVMTVYPSSFKNITYHNSSDRVYFELKNAILTKGDKDLSLLYKDEYDRQKKLYTVTFPSAQADLGEGFFEINDSYLKSFEVRSNKEEGTTSLIFRCESDNAFLVYTRKLPVTTITVIRPDSGKQKTVVIDAGHGGTQSGTVYGDLMEKDLNLDIAKRLNALLKKANIKTYMLRVDDSDIDNYERVYIANKLNAGLFLSVHINAMNSKNYRGTMTLYCPSANGGFNGRSFAGVIQKNLLSTLKTVDRDIRSRYDLIVLRETNMPSAIAEIAFLTNSADRANLKKESFRQKAAQALYDSIVKALQFV